MDWIHFYVTIAALVFITLILAVGFAVKLTVAVQRGIAKSKDVITAENFSQTGKVISLEELAQIEGKILSLSQVFIFAEIVEQPEGTLRKSVQTNFQRGVQYNFIISKNKYTEFKSTYLQFFNLHAKIAQVNPEDVIELYPLEMEWGDKPYIFYRFRNDDKTNIIGFVGNEVLKGIAKSYTIVDNDIAFTIFNAACAACQIDLNIHAQREEFKFSQKDNNLKIAV